MGMRELTKKVRRPKKSGCDRRRREKVQKKRVLALGMSEAAVAKLNPRQIKDILKRPAKVKKA